MVCKIIIWWAALAVTLGLAVPAEFTKNLVSGDIYPIDKIQKFISDNKGLIRRIYGDFELNMNGDGSLQQTKERKKRRYLNELDISLPPGVLPTFWSNYTKGQVKSQFVELRNKRQTDKVTQRVDVCESRIEVTNPLWAPNSNGSWRAIVNTDKYEQIIHQEICSKGNTSRCQGECSCEQKYKWHRLMAYDPEDDCKGVFADWFLFPSCCVCKCNP